MRRFNKSTQLHIRLTKEQKNRVAQAAKKVSADRKEMVDPSTLARMILLPAVDNILAAEAPAQDPAEAAVA